MNEPIRAFNELIAQVGNYLQNTHGYSGNTVGAYSRGWQRLKEFMVSNGIHHYDQKVEEQFLYYEFEGRKGRKLSKQEQFLANGTRKLTEFKSTGQIKVPNLPPKKAPVVFNGALGEAIVDFLDYKHVEERLSTIRLHCYKRCLFLFLEYCNKNKVHYGVF